MDGKSLIFCKNLFVCSRNGNLIRIEWNHQKGEIRMVLDKKTLRNIFIGVAICIVLYWGLHDAERLEKIVNVFKDMLSPFILGAGLAFILNVPMRAFEGWLTVIPNQTLRRCLALLMTFAFVALIVAVVFMLLIPQIGETI